MKAPGSAGMKIPETTEKLVNLLSYSSDKTLAEKCRWLTPEDWQVVLEEGEQRGLALVLYDRLCAADGEGVVPGWVMERLRQAYLAATARNMVMLHHAGAILKGLKERGIEAIVLKGLYLVEHVYPQIGLRTFSDLDLLVRKERLAETLRLMQSLGYRLSTWYDPGAQNTDIKHLPPLEKPDHPTIELHWTILEEDEPFTIDVEGLWQRAAQVNVAGVEALALDLEDLLLHLSMHFTYQHRLRAGLRNLYDIAEVLRQNADQVDWRKLAGTAREWGAQRVTWLTLRLLEKITGLEAAPGVMTSLLPDPVDPSMMTAALEQVLTKDEARVALTPDLAGLPAAGFFTKIKLVWKRVFIPRRLLAREYNIDMHSLKLYRYYLVRLRDLWRRYARSGWRLMTGEAEALSGANAKQENARLREWMGRGGKR